MVQSTFSWYIKPWILNCSDLILLSSGLLRWEKPQWGANCSGIFLTKGKNYWQVLGLAHQTWAACSLSKSPSKRTPHVSSLICSFNRYSLNTYYVLGTVLAWRQKREYDWAGPRSPHISKDERKVSRQGWHSVMSVNTGEGHAVEVMAGDPSSPRALRRHLEEESQELRPKRQVRLVRVVVLGLGVGVGMSSSWME